MTSTLEVALAANLEEIGRLAECVEVFGEENELPMKVVFNLNLAFDELITNVISYGLEGAADESITVRLNLIDGVLVAEIEDTGRPFDPFEDAPDPDTESDIADRPIGGLGVHLVKTLIPQVGYRRDAGKNHVTLTYPLG